MAKIDYFVNQSKYADRSPIALVSCTKAKRPHQCRARELYMASPQFFQYRRLAQLFPNWYIMSAKHGLVHPETIIGPYDQTLDNSENYEWARGIVLDLIRYHSEPLHLIFFAGKRYFNPIINFLDQNNFNITFETPTEGLGIFQSMKWAKRQWETYSDPMIDLGI